MIQLRIAEGCGPTGRLLERMLRERGVSDRGGPEGVVCWGTGYHGQAPSLNRAASHFNKLQQLEVLSAPESHNLRTVPIVRGTEPGDFPAFARQASHVGGRDIRLCLQPEHAQMYLRNGWSYLTRYVPLTTEFRVWVYRRRHLGTYRKVLARPNDFLRRQRFGCNYDNGYSFQLVPEASIPRPAVEMASTAVQALGLDFGAVDILQGKDNQFYILEVNTAPGVEGDGRQVIRSLADRIASWYNHGMPRRNGDADAPRGERRPRR